MTDLVEFLRARLDEDEQAARAAAAGGRWHYEDGDSVGAWTLYDEHWAIASLKTYRHGDYDYSARMPAIRHPAYVDADANGAHIARHDPQRVLADVAAKRAIVDQYARCLEWRREGRNVTSGELIALLFAVSTLAKAYADHPDYREEWRSSPPAAR